MTPYTILNEYDNYLLEWEGDDTVYGFVDDEEKGFICNLNYKYISKFFTKNFNDEYVPWTDIFGTSPLKNEEALKRKHFFLIMTPHTCPYNILSNLKKKNKQKLLDDAWKQFPKKMSQAINDDRCTLIINLSNEYSEIGEYVENFWLKWFKLANIKQTSNILMLVSTYFKNKDLKLKWIFWSIFETSVKKYVNIPYTNKKYHNQIKKFLCLNCRPKKQRIEFMQDLKKNNILNDTNYSLITKDEYVQYDRVNVLSLKRVTDNVENQQGHYMPQERLWKKVDECFMKDNIIFIVTETLFNSQKDKNISNIEKQKTIEPVFLTEKTFKPIKMKMPFIVYGQPYVLKTLKKYGYKTFSSFWDESYDEIENNWSRKQSIVNLIIKLNQYSTKELYDLVQNMNEILQYNYDHMMKRVPEENLINIINDIK